MSQHLTPDDFDLDAWINGARATERSVEFFARGDLVATAEDLLRRYEAAVTAVRPEDRGIGDDSPEALLAEIERVNEELQASRTTWTVRALSPDAIKAANDAARAENEAAPEVTEHVLAAAVCKVTDARGRVLATSTTVDQLRGLRQQLGTRQLLRLMNALNEAIDQEPKIVAPSSRRR